MLRHSKNEAVGMPQSGTITAPPLPPPPTHNFVLNGKSTATPNTGGGSPLDALPKQFVASMKTLFDILDDHQTGFVKFSDIERGWQDDGCKGLPKGVIVSLRKVTPASGLLSFERFCAGLKLCLLRNQTPGMTTAATTTTPAATNAGDSSASNKLKTTTPTTITSNNAYHKTKSPMKQARPPSAPLLEIENPLPTAPWNPTTVIRSRSQRTLSMPQLSPYSDVEIVTIPNGVPSYNTPQPPPKPPRAAAVLANSGVFPVVHQGPAATTGSLDKAQIRHALQNWQMNILLNEMDAKDPRYHMQQHHNTIPPYRGCADGSSSSATDSALSGSILGGHCKKAVSKRREPRRHTLQNGIDYNMLKRSKQYEEEREMLLIGLQAVDKAHNWYLRQLANVDERIKYLRMGTHEQWSEVQQERLNFQRARVLEVNRNLAVLTDTWERGGFPMHFNLAIRSSNKPNANQRSPSPSSSSGAATSTPSMGTMLQSSDRLRHQNRHLMDEVSVKSERISLLEREKQALIHEMYEMQQRISERASTRFVNVLSQPSPVCSSSSGGLGDADVVY